jgi:predicted lactoylglutathione lyase
MVIGEDAYAMLLVEERFKDFALNEPVDANAQTQAILAVTVDSREEVDDLTEKALASGGAPAADPQEMDFMYSRSFRDPDGHHWELFWMDMSQVPHEAPAESSAT